MARNGTNGAWRMTTSKQYDHLNRLLQIGAVLYTSAAVSSAYTHNDANQRIQATLADGSYWRYEYDKLGQVTSGMNGSVLDIDISQ